VVATLIDVVVVRLVVEAAAPLPLPICGGASREGQKPGPHRPYFRCRPYRPWRYRYRAWVEFIQAIQIRLCL